MKFLIKIQFYNNSVPIAIGEFTIEAENKRKAILKLARELKSKGYAKNDVGFISAEKL